MEKMVPEKKKSTDRLDAIIDARAGLIEELAKRHNMSESNIRELIGGL
jgi:Mor family transcriptional regulator